MSDSASLGLTVVRHRLRWHVIDELDVAQFVARHGGLRSLCDQLEDCADGLPLLPAARTIARLNRYLTDGLAADLALDLEFLHENFGHPCSASLSRPLLWQITDRQAASIGHATDIVAALNCSSDDLRPPSVETIGYMLRSFFDGCRDALAFNELAVLKLGSLRLTVAARTMLIACLDRGRR